jgi:hypothetical protein
VNSRIIKITLARREALFPQRFLRNGGHQIIAAAIRSRTIV